jgi:hypothetical protein
MNGSRSDSTDFRNIPHLKQILVAVHEFLLAGRRTGGRAGGLNRLSAGMRALLEMEKLKF